jgi:hypothetical protein
MARGIHARGPRDRADARERRAHRGHVRAAFERVRGGDARARGLPRGSGGPGVAPRGARVSERRAEDFAELAEGGEVGGLRERRGLAAAEQPRLQPRHRGLYPPRALQPRVKRHQRLRAPRANAAARPGGAALWGGAVGAARRGALTETRKVTGLRKLTGSQRER